MDWQHCRDYMRALHDLKDEINRELDAVQTFGLPRPQTKAALDAVVVARMTYGRRVNQDMYERRMKECDE